MHLRRSPSSDVTCCHRRSSRSWSRPVAARAARFSSPTPSPTCSRTSRCSRTSSEGKRYDCGSKLGYLQATVEYGLKHEALGEKFSEYLIGLAAKLK
jgi:hypothetical protein